MSRNRIVVRDEQGRVIDINAMRPTAHSGRLNAAVQLLLNASDGFDAAVAKSQSLVHYTSEGWLDMARGHAGKFFSDARKLYADMRTQAVGEREIAADRFNAAMSRRLPSLDSNPGRAMVMIELGKQLLSDARLRGMLVDMVMNDAEVSFTDVERIEAGASLPLALTGLTQEQKGMFRAFLIPDETAALGRASAALDYVDELTGVLVQKISGVAKMNLNQVSDVAGDAVVQTVGRVSLRPLNVQYAPKEEVNVTTENSTSTPPAEEAEVAETAA